MGFQCLESKAPKPDKSTNATQEHVQGCEKYYVSALLLDKRFPKASFWRAQFQKTCSRRKQGSQERRMPQQSIGEQVARFPKMFASLQGARGNKM